MVFNYTTPKNYKTLLADTEGPTGSGVSLDNFANNYAGPIMGILGGIQTGYGAYSQARDAKGNLDFQADMATINARMAERTAQSILRAGEQEQGNVGLKAGKVKSAQKARQGARGVQIGVGSAAEEVATTDLMKETDMMTINANAVRQAAAARTQSMNYTNESLMKGTTADSINPYMSASESLIGSATTVASSWYRNRRMSAVLDKLGV